MSSLRHSVLEKSLRKSLRKFQGRADSSNTSEISSIEESTGRNTTGSTGRNTPGIPSASSARTRKRRNNRNKKTPLVEKVQEVQEGNLEVLNENTNRPQDMSCTTVSEEMVGERENKRAYLEEEKGTSQGVDVKYQLPRQGLIDFALQLECKYERLRQLLDSLKNDTLLNIKSTTEERINNLKEAKNAQHDHLYKMEEEKLKLELQLDEIKKENDNLKSQLEAKEKEILLKNETKQDIGERTNIYESQSPRATSRVKRRSMINQTINGLTLIKENQKSKEELYEDMILDLQDVLDFYSVICGVSMWKDTRIDVTSNSSTCEEDSMLLKCKIQIPRSKHDGITFDMSSDLAGGEVILLPCPEEKDIPSLLRTGATYDVDDAYLVVKELLNLV